jgi:DNA (cytosine-5)-methyltransferase 1
MRELALFAGAGGGILGGTLLGWRTVCAVEIEPFCREVLLRRQLDGCLPRFPIWDDVCTFDGKPWRGCVDIVTGGFPCQDISAANVCNGTPKGLDGARSGLWTEMARIIREVRPRFALVENSPMFTARGLGIVLGDLAEMGMDARWGVLGAGHAGAYHARERIFLVAYPNGNGLEGRDTLPPQGWRRQAESIQALAANRTWPAVSNPRAFGNGNGLVREVDRLKAIGNGQVPAVVRLAWNLLKPT